ncbi:MAG TPA: protoporphyrinogen oxidase, partial [Bacteroidota bacterium]|nr:protoporphyrinogen oxidase [Bacteroidota bacterium]
MPKVAIIGGGITGLTAAYLLKKKGVGVSLHDAQDRPGGVIRTTRREGFLAEHGPNSILLTSPLIMELVGDLGLGNRVTAPGDVAKNRFIVRGRRPLRLPLSPGTFLTTPLFSLRAKLRLLREPFIGRSPADAEESLGDFVRRRIGREFLEYAINPFVAGVYAGDPEMLSVRHSFPKLHALEQKYGSLIRGQIFGAKERKKRPEAGKNEAGMISFDEGLQVLTDALAGQIGPGLKLGQGVASMRRAAGGWEIVPEGGTAIPGFGAVLYAGSAHALSSMAVGNGGSADLSVLSEIHYPPVTSLVLGFRRELVGHPLDGFGVLIPEVEPFAILGVLFSSSLFPGRAPEGFVTLTCFLG